jgi:pSer/pThr/pTyr-binding forkhead associated (FHA) protein
MLRMVRVVLKVTKGPDAGKRFEVDGARAVIGRSERADVRLTDPAAGWEHAAIVVSDREAVLENLSAAGLRLNGASLEKQSRIRHSDVIGISPITEVLAEVYKASGRPDRRVAVAVVAGAGVIAAGVVAAAVMQAPGKRDATPGPEDWRMAYGALSSQLRNWSRDGVVDLSICTAFDEGWRAEEAGEPAVAREMYTAAWRALQITPQPPKWRSGSDRGGIIGETYSGSGRALGELVWTVSHPRTNGQPSLEQMPEARRADALMRFLSKRVEATRRKSES